MKIWLDDVRPAPDDSWIHTVTAEQTIELLSLGKVKELSLDHDLGIGRQTGYDVACYIEQSAANGTLPCIERISVHSQNIVGVNRIMAALCKARKYWDDWDDWEVR